MLDFTHIVDYIFKQKDKYNEVSDDDKEKFFFIVNRKFARRYPYHAQYFNNRKINKASAMDIWFNYFIKLRSISIPKWYWYKSKRKKTKTFLKKDEANFLLDFYDITQKDLDYLVKYYPDDVKVEIKKYRKLSKAK